MSVSATMWAELARVAWLDAEAVFDSPDGDPREGERLSVLSARFIYRARERGFAVNDEEVFDDSSESVGDQRVRAGVR